jgi:hypothetical protein
VIYCRHRICRTKLKKPVSNRREAFCSRGCHTSFYLNRCVVCEDPLQRRNKTQKVCRKSRCRNAWRAKARFGPHLPSSSVSLASKPLDSISPKRAPKPDRAWAQIAGPKLTTSQLRIAPSLAPCKPWPKPIRKIAPTGVGTMPRRSFNRTTHRSTSLGVIDFQMRRM